MPAVNSAKVKIDRARKHFDLLERLIHRFMKDRPYSLDMQSEVNGGEYSFMIRINKTPPEYWSLLIGEIIYQLRSALDHIVYELSAVDPVTGEKPRGCEFPIFKDETKYRSTGGGGGLYKIRGLDGNAQALIETCQPFNDRQDPEGHVLWVLQELSNIDKHRFLHVSNLITGCRNLTLEVEGDRPVETLQVRQDGPAENGAVLARFRVGAPAPNTKAKVRMKGDIAYHIAFDQAGPARGGPLRTGLKQLGEFVGAIWGEFSALP